MKTKAIIEALAWGFVLWLIGYALGFILFFFVPAPLLGWVIMPIGAAITLFVLFRKIGGSLRQYALMAVVWSVMAIALDYIFIVKLLNPADGYYKPDVYVYYALTFILPLAAGYCKNPQESLKKNGRETGMEKMKFSIKIKAPREKVWGTLWRDGTFREWANIIDGGMYMAGEMREGSEVQFISSVSGYGVTSLVEKLAPNEFVLFRQMADTKEGGRREREKEWTGGTESYSLAEKGGVTTLVVEMDVPRGQEGTFKARFPKALERVKVLAEKRG